MVGPTCFEDLKRVNGVVHDTFQSACRARGLLGNAYSGQSNSYQITFSLDDDSHLNQALVEASLTDSPRRMRSLFCIILAHCQPSNPLLLWNNHKTDMASDILHRRNMAPEEANDFVYNLTLIEIENKLSMMGSKPLVEYGLPPTNRDRNQISYEMERELMYSPQELDATLEDVERLNPEQRLVFDEIIQMLEAKEGGLCFIDAPGGTGNIGMNAFVF